MDKGILYLFQAWKAKKKKVSGLFYLSGGRSDKVSMAWPSDNFKYLKPCGSMNSSCNHQWIPTVLKTKSRLLNSLLAFTNTTLATSSTSFWDAISPCSHASVASLKEPRSESFTHIAFSVWSPFSLLFLRLYLVNSSQSFRFHLK